jgi:hypothetical protein
MVDANRIIVTALLHTAFFKYLEVPSIQRFDLTEREKFATARARALKDEIYFLCCPKVATFENDNFCLRDLRKEVLSFRRALPIPHSAVTRSERRLFPSEAI